MPNYLIQTDAATKVPKECTEEQAAALKAQGFGVELVGGEPEPVEAPAEPAAPEAVTPAPARKTTKKIA